MLADISKRFRSSSCAVVTRGCNDRLLIETEVERLNEALSYRFTLSVVTSSERFPESGSNEITVAVVVGRADMVQICGPFGPLGCATVEAQDAILVSARTFYPQSRGVFDMHELGHAIGLCHVDAR